MACRHDAGSLWLSAVGTTTAMGFIRLESPHHRANKRSHIETILAQMTTQPLHRRKNVLYITQQQGLYSTIARIRSALQPHSLADKGGCLTVGLVTRHGGRNFKPISATWVQCEVSAYKQRRVNLQNSGE
jgi:hypothetical protein